jgi:hypothetical protein
VIKLYSGERKGWEFGEYLITLDYKKIIVQTRKIMTRAEQAIFNSMQLIKAWSIVFR